MSISQQVLCGVCFVSHYKSTRLAECDVTQDSKRDGGGERVAGNVARSPRAVKAVPWQNRRRRRSWTTVSVCLKGIPSYTR